MRCFTIPAHKGEATEAGPSAWWPDKTLYPERMTLEVRTELLRHSFVEDPDSPTFRHVAVRRVEAGLTSRTAQMTRIVDGETECHGCRTDYVPGKDLRHFRDNGTNTRPEYEVLEKEIWMTMLIRIQEGLVTAGPLREANHRDGSSCRKRSMAPRLSSTAIHAPGSQEHPESTTPRTLPCLTTGICRQDGLGSAFSAGASRVGETLNLSREARVLPGESAIRPSVVTHVRPERWLCGSKAKTPD